LDLEETRLGRPVVAGLGALLLIAAGAERLVARAGQRADADRWIRPRRLEAVDQLVDGARAERVHALRPRDRDPREPALDGVGDVGERVLVEGHGGLQSAEEKGNCTHNWGPRRRWGEGTMASCAVSSSSRC